MRFFRLWLIRFNFLVALDVRAHHVCICIAFGWVFSWLYAKWSWKWKLNDNEIVTQYVGTQEPSCRIMHIAMLSCRGFMEKTCLSRALYAYWMANKWIAGCVNASLRRSISLSLSLANHFVAYSFTPCTVAAGNIDCIVHSISRDPAILVPFHLQLFMHNRKRISSIRQSIRQKMQNVLATLHFTVPMQLANGHDRSRFAFFTLSFFTLSFFLRPLFLHCSKWIVAISYL